MDDERAVLLAVLAQQRETQRQKRAAMDEVVSELRQALLQGGADADLLREFELNAADLVLLDGLERTLEARIRYVEQSR